MTPTFFRESDYRDSGCGAAIERLVDDFGFRYPGIGQVEHVYFYAVGAVDEETRREYLQQAYRLGHEFESSLAAGSVARQLRRAGDGRGRCEMKTATAGRCWVVGARCRAPVRAGRGGFDFERDDRADARERAAEVDVPQHQRDSDEHGANPGAARERTRGACGSPSAHGCVGDRDVRSRRSLPSRPRSSARGVSANLLRMGHCAPTVMQTVVDASASEAKWLVKLTAGLPGGIGNTRGECGGLTAPLVVIGLRHGRDEIGRRPPRAIEKGHDLLQRFEAAQARPSAARSSATLVYRSSASASCARRRRCARNAWPRERGRCAPAADSGGVPGALCALARRGFHCADAVFAEVGGRRQLLRSCAMRPLPSWAAPSSRA